MKKAFLLLFLFCLSLNAQNKPILYGFDNIPQGLLVNPGMETTYRAHIGVPMLSGLFANANISGFSAADLFGDDGTGLIAGTDFTTKLRNVVNGLNDNKDYLSINAQIEVLSGGYKINDRDYVSGGFYTELDAFVGFPKDLFLLALDGNEPYINQNFYASDVNVKADILGVLHLGLTRKFNERFTAGARLKIYSGSLNVTSTRNEGTFVTRRTDALDGIYSNSLFNIDMAVQSSGILDEEDEVRDITPGSIFGGTVLSKNFGLGLDFGFTYHVNEQVEITGSFLDLGFLTYAKENRNAFLDGSYTFSGVTFMDSSTDYYQEFKDELEESVVFSENSESYTTSRPLKLNASVRYSFGQSRYESNCHDIRKKDFFDNAVGAQVYSIFRPNGMRLALTGFYERKFAEFLNTKVTWTVDDFSATNFGLGISSRIWKFNVYGGVNNIFGLADLSKSHTATAQFGINFLIN